MWCGFHCIAGVVRCYVTVHLVCVLVAFYANDMVIVVVFFVLMMRRPPRSTQSRSSAASDVYKRQALDLCPYGHGYGASGSIHFQTPGKTIGRVHGNSAHCVVPDMLLYFQYDLLTIGTAYFQCMAYSCLLYTSDAADDLLCVDLGGRRILKKKKKTQS